MSAWPASQPNYTIKAAAARLECSTRTIERWVRGGMACREVAGIVVIDHDVLLARYRRWLRDNPRMKGSRNRK